MSTLARRRNRDTNIWPGFVDALATLLMVIIFVLMIFIVAQFYLTQILSGKDETLARLTQQVAELSDLLSLEREASAELRVTVAQLSAELQTSITQRDSLAGQVDQLLAARDNLESRLAALVAERAVLQQRLDEAAADREGLDARLLEVLEERDALLGKLTEVEDELRTAVAERTEMAANLDDALTVIEANRETIELQLRDLERLRRDIAALREVRDGLESEVARLIEARIALRGALTETETERDSLKETLADTENERDTLRRTLTEAETERDSLTETLTTTEGERDQARQRITVLLGRLDTAATEITRLEDMNADTRAEIAELLRRLETAGTRMVDLTDALAAERDTTKKLEAALAKQTERTSLAQSELEQRDIRLEELFSEYETVRGALDEEKTVSNEAKRQVDLLNAQLAALRDQLARIEAALAASEALNVEQRTRIVDLGRRLNAALATKVQELARFRSEFFGRLREVLSDRDDIRIVGDRFVFQSEVLFASGSADIGIEGQLKLAQLANTLTEIAGRIPGNIAWILQVEGHTDTVPIFNEQFANNWELSTARAISVVRFLIAQGIPPERLAATGYGEHQPIAVGELERNRRIEMKLTQR